MRDGDRQLLKDTAVAVTDTAAAGIDAVVGAVPGLSLAWGLSKALLGKGLVLRQQKALEWVEMVRKNPDLFKRQVLESEEFQDGFVVALENYLKTRSILKRAMARKIFSDFARRNDRVSFQLERYDDTLQKISDASIHFLSFLEKTIAPLKELAVLAHVNNIDLTKSDKSRDWWVDNTRETRALSKSFEQWMLDEYSPNNPKLKEHHGINGIIPPEKLSELFEIEKAERSKYAEILSELDYLGIIKIGLANSPGWGGGASSQWRYTKFGEEFVRMLN